MWFYSSDDTAVEQAYVDGFGDLGFEVFDTFRQEGSPVIIPVNSRDGQWVDIVLVPPELLASEPDLAEVDDLVPDGFGLVLILGYDEYGYE